MMTIHTYIYIYTLFMVSTFSRGVDQPTGIIIIVDNVLARGKLNRENVFFPLFPFAPENLLERDMFGRPRRLASARSFSTLRPNHQSSIINHQSSIWDSSRFQRGCPFIPSTAIGSVPPCLSGHHVFAYRWRSLLGTGPVILKVASATGAAN